MELFICIKMDLALNNLKWLNKQTNNKDIKLLLSMWDVSKHMEPDKIPSKILKHLLNESFVTAISKLFEKRTEYEMTQYIWKIAIEILQYI